MSRRNLGRFSSGRNRIATWPSAFDVKDMGVMGAEGLKPLDGPLIGEAFSYRS